MPSGLDVFTQQQIDAQGLSVKEFARRAGLGLSHAYQILRGERNTRPAAETFDAVAKGLNMTPAEMAVAMGRMTAEHDPDEAEAIALFRQVPADKRPAAKDMLRGLSVQPIRPPKKRVTKPPDTFGRDNDDDSYQTASHPVLANRIFTSPRVPALLLARVAV